MPVEENALIYESILKVAAGESLTRQEAVEVMELIMTGEVTDAQLGALMMGLHLKGETVDEIAGFFSVMREKAIRVRADDSAVDIVGTGGDRAGTFNISTTAAFVLAASGVTVAKHGNRAASGRCGSAEVLEELGANAQLDAAGVERTIERTGMGFMFAPMFHPAMKYAAGPRRELRIRTVFNILGPVTNPARVKREVLGVPDAELAAKMIQVWQDIGLTHALVVHGRDGLDEITLTGPSIVYELKRGEITSYEIAPEDFGLCRVELAALRGGDCERNAEITTSVLRGERGPFREVVLLNAAAGLLAADLAADFKEGIYIAERTLDSGAAIAKLDEFIRCSNEASVSDAAQY